MYAHITYDSVAVLHKRAPATRMHELIVRAHRRRSRPHLIIEIFRRCGVGGVLACAHVVIAIDLDQSYLSEFARANDLIASLGQMRRAASLGADLHDAIVPARGSDHRLPLDHI